MIKWIDIIIVVGIISLITYIGLNTDDDEIKGIHDKVAVLIEKEKQNPVAVEYTKLPEEKPLYIIGIKHD
jgi:hypothetical protein